MKKIIGLLFFTIIVSGCAPILENMPGFEHTAALILGSEQSKVIQDAEHVLGEPLDVLNDKEGKLQVRRYKFMAANDMALYFYDGRFVQLALVDVGTDNYPEPSDHQFGKMTGFILSKQGKNGEVKLSFLNLRK
ncbi:MAG: hypothetical protein WC552_06600 [Candidatus Omnitrophota bacterium]